MKIESILDAFLLFLSVLAALFFMVAIIRREAQASKVKVDPSRKIKRSK